jgi:hypothetical protein
MLRTPSSRKLIGKPLFLAREVICMLIVAASPVSHQIVTCDLAVDLV